MGAIFQRNGSCHNRQKSTQYVAGAPRARKGGMQPFSAIDRQDLLRTARRTTFDVAVVGAGITGAGIARDAALRGLSVLLLDMDDVGSGTSSKSSRLIHGGLRYLEQGKLGLVHESVAERWKLMRLAPHLARPLPFLFPVYSGEKPSLGLVAAGTLIYSLLSSFRTPGARFKVRKAAVRAAEPHLGVRDLAGCAGYYDCATNDARLTLENAMDAAALGAVVLPRSEVKAISRRSPMVEIGVEDHVLGVRWTASARTLAVAAGPWTDSVLPLADPGMLRWLRPTKGVHLVFDAARFPVRHAVVMKAPADHRVTFAVPWGRSTYVGTTDTDFPNPHWHPEVDAADAAYLLGTVNHYFPDLGLTVDDVVGAWAGLRPLIAGNDGTRTGAAEPSDLSREERVEALGDRIVVVAGGKLTTYRRMAQRAVDKLAAQLTRQGIARIPGCTTHKRPLPGGNGLCTVEDLTAELARDFPALPSPWLDSLASRLGVIARDVAALADRDRSLLEPLPGTDQIRLAEVRHSIKYEWVGSVEDFLERRTTLRHTSADAGVAAARVVADELKDAGIVSAIEAHFQVESYRLSVGRWRRTIKAQAPEPRRT